MNVTEAIEARRAVRSYSPRKVDEPTVQSLLRAAVRAPSALNEQTWIFAVVQDVRQLERWSTRAKALLLDAVATDPKTGHYRERLLDPGFNIFYDASTLVVIGSRVRGAYTDADCWLAAKNMMLAACDAGLGSCPIGFAIPFLNAGCQGRDALPGLGRRGRAHHPRSPEHLGAARPAGRSADPVVGALIEVIVSRGGSHEGPATDDS